MKFPLTILFATVLGWSYSTNAASMNSSSGSLESPRQKKPLSIYFGINSPSPSLVGVNVSYQINEDYRAWLGHGSMTATTGISYDSATDSLVLQEATASTIGLGIEQVFSSGGFAPVVGLKLAMVSLTGDISVGGFEESGTHLYGNLGFDWQTQSGFNLSSGYNLSASGGEKSGVYVNMGWAYDWIKL